MSVFNSNRNNVIDMAEYRKDPKSPAANAHTEADSSSLAGASIRRNDVQGALASSQIEGIFAKLGKIVEAFSHMLGIFKGAPKGAHYVLNS